MYESIYLQFTYQCVEYEYQKVPGGFLKLTKYIMNPVDYIKEVQAEMTHVKWPTRKTTLYFTIVVIVVSILTALYLGFFDLIFSRILGLFL